MWAISDHAAARHRPAAFVLSVLVTIGSAGCGRREIPRFDLSGTVTYDGQPVPRGYIVFRPDRGAGNDGPGSQADIRDGRYATLPGQGTIGGLHAIQVFGFDGKPYEIPAGMSGGGPTLMNQVGKPIFAAATLEEDLPKEATVRNLVVPRQPVDGKGRAARAD